MHPCKYEYNNVTVHTLIALIYHTQFMCEVQLMNHAPLNEYNNMAAHTLITLLYHTQFMC